MKSGYALLSLVLLGQAVTSLGQDSLFNGISARALGPTSMGGRISDIAVYEKEPRIFYVATAAGGVYKTESGGMTMKVVFDSAATSAGGAIAVSQKNPNLVWYGTGEASSRNSTSWGNGVYLSKDGGSTWTHMGLELTGHICDILIDPKNDDIVYVGATGDLWGASEHRGVYKTTDGGRSWNKVLFVNNLTGPADLVMDPSNPNILFAAMWERLRFPYNWISGGAGSGLYKSTDAGKSWRKITKGIPAENDTQMIGRIGLSFHRKDPNLMVATIEASTKHPDQGPDQWRRTPNGGTFISKDKGESWTKVNNLNPRPFYFSMPRFDPNDPNRIYVYGVSVHLSTDQGKTFRAMGAIDNVVHVDYHAAWINPNDSNHIIVGNDGGIYQSRDMGVTWEHMNNMVISQFYAVGFDFRKPYYVYGGLQDNGSWGGPTQTRRGGPTYQDWYNVGGGDGFYVVVDPSDWRTVYSESQGGAVSRTDIKTGARRSIVPRGQNTTPPVSGRIRFNWSTPIHISPHNSSTVYVGGQYLFRSVNRGDNWEVISEDLTTNDAAKLRPGFGSTTPESTGAENHCTIVSISESPARPGVIWCGTDDGNVWVTRDGGKSWTQVNANIPDAPKFGWISRVHASKHAAGRCYVTIDNHRMNDFKTYAYMTNDYGATWTKINGNLPANEPMHLIRDGLRNPDLLFAGTEFGLWMSLDRGQNWSKLKNFPSTPVHDFHIHPREQDLVIGTHGRGIYTMNVSALEDLTKERLAQDVFLTRPQNYLILGGSTGGIGDGNRVWQARNSQPGADFYYYLKAPVTGDVKISVQEADGNQVVELNGTNNAGLNLVQLPRSRRLAPGDYRIVLRAGGKEYMTSLRAEEATWED